MQIFKDLHYEQDDYAITGFINSNGDLEHNIYRQVDFGDIIRGALKSLNINPSCKIV